MTTRTLAIDLQLRLDGDSLSGRAQNGAAGARDFSGWIGLMATIDALIGAHPEEDALASIDVTAIDVTRLRDLMEGRVVAPGDDGFDAARLAFNLAVDQHPAAVAFPADEREVAAVVGFARDTGLRVAPQRTGHNAAPLGDLADTVLLKTDALDAVEIDAERRIARVGGGAKWEQVLPAAAEHGLAALHGSTPDVSLAGYSLGGGLGWYARKLGLQANSLTAIELVTADGRLRRVDADNEPNLFWALRGGGGNFGVVTTLEFRLYEIPEIYAGMLFFPLEQAAEALHTWREITAGAPEELTTSARLMNLPPLEELPEFLRGRSLIAIDGAFMGSAEDGAAVMQPLFDLGPELNTWGPVPPMALAEMHMDPSDPMPSMTEHALLGELPAAAVEAMIELGTPGEGPPLPVIEIRHTGGALGRHSDGHGALSTLPGEYMVFAGGMAGTPELDQVTTTLLARVADAFAPYAVGHYGNFLERPVDSAELFGEANDRLVTVKAQYDPENVFRANHPVNANR